MTTLHNVSTTVDHSTGHIILQIESEDGQYVLVEGGPLDMRTLVEAVFDAMERLALRIPDGNDRVSAPVLIADDGDEAKKVLRCHGESLHLASPAELKHLASGD